MKKRIRKALPLAILTLVIAMMTISILPFAASATVTTTKKVTTTAKPTTTKATTTKATTTQPTTASYANEDGSITVHKYGIGKDFVPNADFIRTGGLIGNNVVIGTNDDGNVTLADLPLLENIPFMLERVTPQFDAQGRLTGYARDNSFTPIVRNTNISGVVYFGDLEQGLYRVSEQLNTVTKEIAPPTVVSVPLDNKGEWIYDIHIYPKNLIESPEIHKDVSYLGNQHDTFDKNEDVKWIITTSIPLDAATSKKYVITDDLMEVFRYKTGSLSVSYISAANSSKVTLTPGTHYTLAVNTNGKTAFPWQDSLTITLTAAGRAEIAKALPAGNTTDTFWLTTEFVTNLSVPDSALGQYLGTVLPNDATLEYTNSANVDYEIDSEKPEVHLAGITLRKVDAKTGAPLAGAEFKIYRSEANAKAGVNAIADPNDASKDWVVVTDSNGSAMFLGLSYGNEATASTPGGAHNAPNASTDYWLVETKAPANYNLIKGVFKVTANTVSHLAANSLTITNSKFDLPLTGGEGTLYFTLGGLVLIAAGCVLFFQKKKKVQA